MIAPARRAALRILRSVQAGGTDLAAALDRERPGLADPRDRALASELCHGVLRWRASLDHVVAWAGERPPSAFDGAVLDVLRLGAYQILHLTRVPAAAAVHDAVDQCRAEGFPRAGAAVNAILRTISRRRAELPLPGPEHPLEHLSITLSHPPWLAARWLDRLGVEAATAWATFNNTPAPLVIRAHTWRETRESLAAWLQERGVVTTPTLFAPDGLVVTSGNPVIDAADGVGRRFSLQDESAQLVATFVGAQPGETLLDTCAAPGGKTTALAGALSPTGRVVASDLRPRRVRLLRQTIAASGAPGVYVVRADASRPLPVRPVFDAVLVDAPCSGLGTIRRDPDIRWRRAEGDLVAFAGVQSRMLATAAAAVRPGGRLVYATCSSEPDENQAVVEQFLRDHPAWRMDADPGRMAALPPGVRACLDDGGWLAPRPDRHGLEPFFACALRAPA
jgi:16S rRNA (cytosine967-C5)-methyltransferase